MVRLPHVQMTVPDGWGLISREGPLMWAPLDASPDALQVSVPRTSRGSSRIAEAFAELNDPPLFPGSSNDEVSIGSCAYGEYATCRIRGAPIEHFHVWLLMSSIAEPVMVTWESDRPIGDDVRRIVMAIQPASPIRREFFERVLKDVAEDLARYGEVPMTYVVVTSNAATVGTVDNDEMTPDGFTTVVDQVRTAAVNASEAALFVQMTVRNRATGEVEGEAIEVFVASRDRRERWWVPITTERGEARVGTPTELDFFPSHPAYVLFPLPYPVVHTG